MNSISSNRTLRALLCVMTAVLLSAGCRKNTKELEHKILQHDPAFQDVLDNRDDLRQQIALQRSAYEKKVSNFNSRIAALKEQKALARSEYRASVEKVERQLEPMIRDLRADLVDMKRRLELKRMQLRNVERDIKEIEALIEKKDTLAFTQEEIKTWNDRLAKLVEEKAEISSDEAELLENIKMNKLKIKVMKL